MTSADSGSARSARDSGQAAAACAGVIGKGAEILPRQPKRASMSASDGGRSTLPAANCSAPG